MVKNRTEGTWEVVVEKVTGEGFADDVPKITHARKADRTKAGNWTVALAGLPIHAEIEKLKEERREAQAKREPRRRRGKDNRD
jgi:hypothetical protein